jgi:hypothetical protein
MRARVGRACVRTRTHARGKHVFRLGHFRYERPWLKDERRSYITHRSLEAKATPHTAICKTWSGDGEGGTISG